MTKRISVYVVDLGRKYLYFQWIDPATEKRKSQSSKCTTKRDAERAAKDFEDRLNAQLPTGDGTISWKDFRNVYWIDHAESLSRTSQKRIDTAFNVFEEEMSLGRQPLSTITAGFLSTYATKLRTTGRSPDTIVAGLSKIASALRWAKDHGYLSEVPRIPKIARAKGTRAKGRPLTDGEFIKLLCAVRGVVGDAAAPSWSRLLIGLWLSGLRLGEALELNWWDGSSHESALWIDMTGKYPLLGICAESEKGRQNRLLPITPDFGQWLRMVPDADRIGSVFPPVKKRHLDVSNMDYVSKIICRIGKAAGVTVAATGKTASAHDLRRTFGLRWAQKLYPAELQQLMRHASISTTMEFYAMMEARAFAEKLWGAN